MALVKDNVFRVKREDFRTDHEVPGLNRKDHWGSGLLSRGLTVKLGSLTCHPVKVSTPVQSSGTPVTM